MSIFVGLFLVSLDRLIISTAIPQITNDFHSADDIGWYGTAYLLTNCAFQLVFGKLYSVFSVKAVFLASVVLFEAGSALCGAAPTSVAFILGRAIAGLGSGGILSGVIVVIVYALPLHKRPKYQGFFGAVFGISSVTGPLIGGAFTTNVTWRWCFYLNLPLGAVVMAIVYVVLHVPARPEAKGSFRDKRRQLDILGLFALLPGITCLCLALQWGGTTYSVWRPEQAVIPPRIVAQRSIASGFWVSCCLGAHMNLFVYYLPIWFQAVDGISAADSGVRLLPMVIPLVASSIVTGQLVSRVGYYTPFMIFGVCLTAIGGGLLTTLEVGSSVAQWSGFQIIYGIGLGACSQAPNMAAQTVLPRKDVAIGASLMFFAQQLFGAVFTSVGQNVLGNQLANRLAGIPGTRPGMLQSTGATELLNLIPASYRAAARVSYNASLRVCFQVGLVMACLSILGAVGMEWRNVKRNIPAKADQASGERASEPKKGEAVS
ncbi:hypothetical protein CDD83_7935 [Cordyceps sp. RAO-2017]|nr:hypothetical protein CDD83_7935 [Cordyceps sp. RAO-2017]